MKNTCLGCIGSSSIHVLPLTDPLLRAPRNPMFVRVTCTWALSLWSLLLICTWDATALEVVRQGSPCGPNEVPWPSEDGAFHCEAFEEAWKRAEAFLNDNMPPWDLLNRGTLQLGLLPATVTQALQVRQNFSWAAEVPEEIWLNYVLPYASVNEARTDWRRLLFEALKIDAAKRSLAEVTQLVNEKLWSAVRNDTTIVFKAQQTPLIYDTMSAIAFGYASCTGLSIMFLDALRSVGVPARLVGTPAWHGTFADGNHNWVEIWLGHGSGLFGEAWTFLEASPAGPGEHLLNPCDKWFCNPSHFDGKTMSFAAKFDREKEKFNYYPMAWDMENKDIPGVNRTDFYNSICSKC